MEHEKEKAGLVRFRVNPLQVDFQGRFSVIHLCELLLEAAGNHAAALGFGLENARRQQAAWVLTRLNIQVESYARVFEELELQTWVDAVQTAFSTRCFILLDKAGRIRASAASAWMLIDLKSRRPLPIPGEWFAGVVLEGRECPASVPAKIEEAGYQGPPQYFRVRYSDLDIQAHVNSAKYLQWALDQFPLRQFEKQQLYRIEINYLAECHFEDELRLFWKEAGTGIYLMEVQKEGGRPACRARLEWR